MKTYHVTVYSKSGEKLLDETFEATDDQQAKVIGEKLLKEKNYWEYTHRVVSPTGKLLLFQS
ncbi:hypothetical protein GCM10010965_04560 [Caldalkalibacillus thermarum]|uniref:YhzD family protein n=1 Tax=Caldalkalibacillus thermarum TaxID=296745 RepID=UPI00166CADED|nr:YhzD family protein [Caldalkalibacillus thermarum]GGK14635.1 hypothetical protein GCM10010965_04560 [Caldalkalibacillus thermarum]